MRMTAFRLVPTAQLPHRPAAFLLAVLLAHLALMASPLHRPVMATVAEVPHSVLSGTSHQGPGLMSAPQHDVGHVEHCAIVAASPGGGSPQLVLHAALAQA